MNYDKKRNVTYASLSAIHEPMDLPLFKVFKIAFYFTGQTMRITSLSQQNQYNLEYKKQTPLTVIEL